MLKKLKSKNLIDERKKFLSSLTNFSGEFKKKPTQRKKP